MRGLQSRIAPGVLLQTITITLDPYGPPKVELRGRVATGNRRLDIASTAAIVTSLLPASGSVFIREMKDLFAPVAQTGKPPPPI